MEDVIAFNPPIDFLYDGYISKDDFITYSKKFSEWECKKYQYIPKKCHICEKDISSFCNSHTLPRFCLKSISQKGIVMSPGAVLGGPILKQETGVNNSGTFHLICDKCDNLRFSEYETPEKYLKEPSRTMLAQIAMKTALRLMYKRYTEIALYTEIFTTCPSHNEFLKQIMQEDLKTKEQDFEDYKKDLKYAKKALAKDFNKGFSLRFYKKLDYVVPIAVQTELVLETDLNNNIVNHVCLKDTKLQPLHICIFPLDGYSVIFMFTKDNHTRLRDFFKDLNKLSENEQLNLISYLIFLYSEDIYISKKIEGIMKSHKNIKDAIRTSDMTVFSSDSQQVISSNKMTKYLNLSRNLNRYKNFPNLLSKEFKVD